MLSLWGVYDSVLSIILSRAGCWIAVRFQVAFNSFVSFVFFCDRVKDFQMEKIIGIDLGTTNSLVATVDSGIPLVIADSEGRRLTPSVVHFPAADSDPIVGSAANRVRVMKPSETVYSVK